MNPSKTQNSLRLLAHSSADVIVITTSMTFSHESAVVFAQWPQNWPLCLCKGLQQQMIDRCQCPIWRNNCSRWKDEEMNFNLPLLTESWAPRSPSLQGGVSGAAVITADLMIFSCFKQQLVFLNMKLLYLQRPEAFDFYWLPMYCGSNLTLKQSNQDKHTNEPIKLKMIRLNHFNQWFPTIATLMKDKECGIT